MSNIKNNKTMTSKGVDYLLWFFLGIFGVHKFYLHKWVWGILYLFTGGIAGIGWLIDLFILGTQVDTYNLAKANKKLLRQTSQLAQGTVALSEQVAINQNMQYDEIAMQSSNSVVANSPVQSQPNDKVAKLRNIKSLLDAGILTQEEFEVEKQNILNS